MPRFKRKIKQHLARKKHIYFRVGLIAATLGAVIGGTQLMMKEEGTHQQTVKALSGTSEENYQLALEKAKQGEVDEARLMMSRLARLGDTADKPLGFGKAHLWMAMDTLSCFKPDFLYDFPGTKGKQDVPAKLGNEASVLTAQKHLEHAVKLNPDSDLAVAMLAAVLVARGQNNESVEVLLEALSHSDHPHPRFHAPLAHVIMLSGEDLALQEMAWHAFSKFGKNGGLSRGLDFSDRVRYIMSALMLQKYENADIAIRRLEAQHPAGKKQGEQQYDESARTRFLRMAYHYHKAVQLFAESQSDTSSGYQKVVDELERVLTLVPDTYPAVNALSYIAEQEPSLAPGIRKILERILSEKDASDARGKSKVSLVLAALSGTDVELERKGLEESVKLDPGNAEALLRLMKVLMKEETPDYGYIQQLAERALEVCQPSGRAEPYFVLGWCQVQRKKWGDAIISLERSLSGAGDRHMVHRLLAEAYMAVGKDEIAGEHKNRSRQAAR